MRLVSTLIAAAGTLVSTAATAPKTAVRPESPTILDGATFKTHLKPFLTEFCVGCHNVEKHKGDVNLEIYGDTTRVIANRKEWEKVREMLVAREMPPENKPQPPEAQRDVIARFIEAELAKFDCNGPVDPGRVTLRRLNRNEYNNSIRDLVGVDFNPAADFPSDEVGYGFDNIGDVLSLPPLLMEKYLAAAEQVITNALAGDYPPKRPTRRIAGDKLAPSGDDAIRPIEGQGLGLYREGEGWTEFSLAPGEYVLRVRAYGEQAGPEPPKLSVRLGETELKTFAVAAVESASALYEVRTKLESGKQRVSVAYLNNYNVQNSPNPKLNGDRNLIVEWVEMEGPMDLPPPAPPAAYARIITCDPRHEHTRDCARRILQDFARRAYRRPTSAPEVRRLMRFIDIAREDGGGFIEGIQVALQAILTSPHFLFRWELDPEPGKTGTVRPLNDYELASRLSYFLWASMPDEELFSLAEQGVLTKRDIIAAQVRRMLHDPKSRALVENFAGQWLQIRNLDTVTPDPDLFPTFNEELRAAMRQETELFFDAIMREDRSVLELIDCDFTFLNERLARHYGIAGVKGPEFRKVALRRETQRGGILTQASILTITSNPTRTSPVSRGKWVLEQILGTPPPPPPPDVPELPAGEQAVQAASLRQRLEEHRAKAECATCHSKMDPIGFAFENFDAIGSWRDLDGKFPVDSSGTLPSGQSFNGPNELKAILKSQDTFVRSLVEKMLTYALGRGLEYYDKCAVDDIYAAVVADQYRFSSLATAIVESEPFLKKTIGDLP